MESMTSACSGFSTSRCGVLAAADLQWALLFRLTMPMAAKVDIEQLETLR